VADGAAEAVDLVGAVAVEIEAGGDDVPLGSIVVAPSVR